MEVEALVAIYGAGLSTLLAIAALIRWWNSGPRFLVTVFNPEEYWTGGRNFGIVVTNTGTERTTIAKLIVSFHKSKSSRDKEFGIQTIDQKSQMSPAMKKVADPWKPNTSSFVPNILAPGDEYLGITSAADGYDPAKHWIRVKAYPRGSNRCFVGWAKPRMERTTNA